MKHLLLLLITLTTLTFTAAAQQKTMTLRSEMEYLNNEYGVNFVYDSSLDIYRTYNGRSLTEISASNAKSEDRGLDACLAALFRDSGISYQIMKKYVVLTNADSRKKPKDYTIFIEEQHDTLNESVITLQLDPKRNSTQTGLKRINNKDINSGFALFSTPDVIKTLQLLPGVSSGTELLSGFYVHGGDGSDNLFLLDGVPVFQVSHFLGLFSSFNSDVIESLDFYKSGFPARYGSKMSSVVDITTKDGNFEEYHGTFALGLIDGRFQLEGPIYKNKTSFNFGLRRTWTETLSIPVVATINKRNKPDKMNLRYAFTDLNAKITHKFSEDNKLTANFYTGRDVFKYRDDYESLMLDDHNKYVTRREITDVSLSWGNTLGSLNWDYNINDKLSMSSILYYSSSISHLGFSNESIEPDETQMIGQFYNSDLHDIGIRSDFHHKVHSKHILRYGATAKCHLYRPNSTALTEITVNDITQRYVPYSDSLKYNTFEAALYAEDEIAVNDDFSINAGLRYSIYFTGTKAWHSLEPRFAMKYSFNDKLSAKVSYTEMSQPTHLVSSLYIDLPTNIWLPSTSRMRPSRSREVAGGFYSNLSPTIHLNLEGWYKHMYNLIEYAGTYAIFPPLTDWESSNRTGQGRSWGAELDFGYSNGRTQANVYYTLSWSQRNFEDFYPGWYRDRNDNRHKLTLMARHKFGKRFELYGAWNWHSGNRMTIATHETPSGEELFTEPNNVKLPDYHRLDLGFNFVKNTKRGNTSIWNLSLYNAYCRANAITASEEYKSLDKKIVAIYGTSIGIIPIIPTFSYTLKF